MKLHSSKIKFLIKTFLVLTIMLVTIGMYFAQKLIKNQQSLVEAQSSYERTYTETELSGYSGNDPSKPILLALDGLVYDVTAGKEYYRPGGSYHDLAGKDSSKLLHLVGGDIIKRKYPVVGTLLK